MRIRYPTSFVRLLSIGFAVVVMPLVVVLLGNAVSIKRLSEQSQRAVFQAAQITETSRSLVETLTSFERLSRQYVVLGDAALQDSLREVHHEFGELSAQLARLSLSAPQRRELDTLVTAEGAIFDTLQLAAATPPAPATLVRVLDRFEPLAESAQTMLEHNNKAIREAAESLQTLASEAARVIYGQLLVLVPVTLLVVAGFTYLLARPINELDHGIRGLGEGRFGEKIEVSGPEDLEQLGRQLDWLRLRLVELEEQKNRFLRHASHELKTPLTALREGSELLNDGLAGPLSAPQKEIVGILRNNSLQLSRLIEELLAYSAADFQRTSLKLQAVKAEKIFGSVVEQHKLALAARNLNLNVKSEDFLMTIDPERIRVVVDNLLSNAIKYSPIGETITLRAATAVHPDHGREAVIEIIDKGPGIAAEDRDRVFDPFYQGRIPASGPVKGSGLGLSIAREHVLAHGGRLELLPGLESGTGFRVCLPLEAR